MNVFGFLGFILIFSIYVKGYYISVRKSYLGRHRGFRGLVRVDKIKSSTSSSRLFQLPNSKKVDSDSSVVSIKDRLLGAGQAGILAYGVLNFIWYSTATTIVWTKLGSSRIATKAFMTYNIWKRIYVTFLEFLRVLAVVWAGSQMTKPLRITGAIFLAPVAEVILNKVQTKFKISRSDAFWKLSGFLLGTCLLIFCGIIIIPGIIPTIPKLIPSETTRPINNLIKSFILPNIIINKIFHVNLPNDISHPTHLFSQVTKEKDTSNISTYPRNRYNEPIDPKNKRHGWDRHPKILRGFWKIDRIINSVDLNVSSLNSGNSSTITNTNQISQSLLPQPPTAAAPSQAADTIILTNTTQDVLPKIKKNKAHGLKEDKIQIISNVYKSIDHIILKEIGETKVKCDQVAGRGWEFTPANRRILFELGIPEEQLVLRFSGEVTRVPYVVTRASGVIRCRPLALEEDISDFKTLPSSNNNWPVVGEFQMSKLLYGKYGRDRHLADNVKRGLLPTE